MSRIERTPVDSGDATSATELNNTYSDYSQAGALDAPNTRDQAFDLPHFTNTPIVKNCKEAALSGQAMHPSGFGPTAVVVVPASPTIYPPVYEVTTPAGVATPLTLTTSGWTLSPGDVLRVWWDLSVRPNFVSRPWRNANSLGQYPVEDIAGGPDWNITDGMHCWVAFLEWDITDNTLGNFVPVPNQTDFNVPFIIHGVSYTGGYVNQTAATSAISAWSVFSAGLASEGQVPDPAGTAPDYNDKEMFFEHGWHAVSGMWAYPRVATNVTIYGIRVRVTGLMHPMHINGGNSENVLVYDTNVVGPGPANALLDYVSGRISAVHMRGS